MEIVLLIIMMIAIGAMIGGFTNSLAIKMLFRPYQAIYIRNWRIPFTPGLIPKRRAELASQLGNMVVNHLLTPEGIGKKLNDTAFKKEIVTWAQGEVKQLLHSESTIEELAAKHFQASNLQNTLQGKAEVLIENKLNYFIEKYGQERLDDVLPKSLIQKGDVLVPKLTVLIIEKGKNYFRSPEGKEQLTLMIDRFLAGRGTLGNMVSMFLGNERLVDKVQPEVIKLLDDYSTYEFIEKLLGNEWKNIKSWKLNDLLKKINHTELLTKIKTNAVKQLELDKWINSPIVELSGPYEEKIIEEWVPKLTEAVGQAISLRLGEMMKKLRLAEVVKEQVETFSVERLEDMVLSISRREFKMITYLGAVLGGCIGFVQGIIVIFLR